MTAADAPGLARYEAAQLSTRWVAAAVVGQSGSADRSSGCPTNRCRPQRPSRWTPTSSGNHGAHDEDVHPLDDRPDAGTAVARGSTEGEVVTAGSQQIPESGPESRLTLRGAVFLGIGAMVGAGIFALLGQAGEVAGAAVWLSFLIAGAMSAALGYTLVKFGVRYPSSGGIIVYLMHAFREPSAWSGWPPGWAT